MAELSCCQALLLITCLFACDVNTSKKIKQQVRLVRLEEEHGNGKSVAEVREIYAKKRKNVEAWPYFYILNPYSTQSARLLCMHPLLCNQAVEDEIESGKASVNSLKRRQILKSQ